MSNWLKKFEFNENHFASAFVLGVVAFLIWMMVGNPELPLAELSGKYLQRLAIYTAWTGMFLYVFGGHKFDIVTWLKETPIAFAILCGFIIFGASNVLGH